MKIVVVTAFSVSLLYLLSGCTKSVDEIGEMKVVLIPGWSSPTFGYEVFFKTDRGMFHLEFSEGCALKGDTEVNMDGDGFPLNVCQKAFTTHSAGSYRVTGEEQSNGNKLSTCPTTSILVNELEILKGGAGASHVFVGWIETPGASKLVTDSRTGNVGPETITREGVYASAVFVPTSVLNGKLIVNGPMDVRPSSPPARWANCEFNGSTQETAQKTAESLVLVVQLDFLDELGVDPGSLARNIDAAREILRGSQQAEWDNLLQEVHDLGVLVSNGGVVPLGAISNFEYRTNEPSDVGDESTFILFRAD